MNNKLAEFYQQISHRFWVIFLLVIFAITIVLLLYFQSNTKVQQLSQQQLPQWQRQVQFQQQLFKTKQLITKLLFANDAAFYLNQQQTLLEYFQKLALLSKPNNRQYNNFIHQNKMAKQYVERLSRFNSRNQQNKNNSLIELQLVLASLTEFIEQKQQQQQLLYKQITQDKLTDRVTASRARAHARLVARLVNYRHLYQLFSNIYNAITTLSINTSLTDFDSMVGNIEQTLATSQKVLKKIPKQNEISQLHKQLLTLTTLLFDDQKILAKWRNQLHLAENYHQELNLQLHYLEQQSLTDVFINKTIDQQKIQPFIIFVQQYLPQFSFRYYTWLLLALVALIILTIGLVLINLGKNIKNFSAQQTTTLQPLQQDTTQHDELNLQYNQLKIKSEQRYQQTLFNSYQQGSELNTLLSQAMLQAQSMSIDSGLTFAQLYRQLHRTQNKLTQQLLAIPLLATKQYFANNKISADIPLSPWQSLTIHNNVNLCHELYCAIFNAMKTVNQQQNQIYLLCQAELPPLVNLNTRLFHPLLAYLCALLFDKRKNTDLIINLTAKKSAQKMICFSFYMTFEQQTIAENIQLLCCTPKQFDQKQQHEELAPSIAIIRLLWSQLNAEKIIVIELNTGFKLQFELPIALLPQQPIAIATDFDWQQAQFLLISTHELVHEFIDKTITNSNGQLEQIANVALFIKRFTVKKLTETPLTVIFVTTDHSSASLDAIATHLDRLPKQRRPKLFVMQPLFNVAFESNSFYSFSYHALATEPFLQQLQSLIQNELPTNLLLTANYCQNFRFQSTQVEVLLAVSQILQQQNLLRILHWLGLQVTLVSSPTEMLTQWQTGRYLVLLTAFECSPFIELAIGNNVSRAIITLAGQKFEHLLNQEQALAAAWQVKSLDSYLNLKQLTAHLAPWLKAKITAARNTKNKPLIKVTVKAKPHEIAVKNNTTKSTVTRDEVQPFDLSRFARHQGSAELAAFMIDDYLQSNQTNIDKLSQAIMHEDRALAVHAVGQLIITAKIIAADDLLKHCINMQQALINEENNQQTAILLEIKQQHQLIASFAEAV